jgi:RNA polymerase sigma-70 factor (ECF subfamily)
VTDKPLRQTTELDLSARHAEQVAVARVRSGDALALEVIFHAFRDEMLKVAEEIAGSGTVGEEVVQDVFLTIWRTRERWQVNSSLRGYLRRATRNTAMRTLHSRSRGPGESASLDDPGGRLASPEDPRPTPADAAAYDELAAAARQAAAELSPRARDVFLLRRDEELSNQQIAERLGVSVKTVETHMTRALRFMRRKLAPWLDS